MNEAIEALKAGDKARAFELLRRHLVANPQDASAWLWMGEAAPTPSMQRDALQRVLHLVPDHPRATLIRQRIAQLSTTPASLAPPAASAPVVPPPPPEPSTEEQLAQLRGESLHVPPLDESFSPTASPEHEEESTPMGTSLGWDDEEESPSPAISLEHEQASEPVAVPLVWDEEDLPESEPEESGAEELAVSDEVARALRTEVNSSEAGAPTSSRRKGTPMWVWLVLLIALVLIALWLYSHLCVKHVAFALAPSYPARCHGSIPMPLRYEHCGNLLALGKGRRGNTEGRGSAYAVRGARAIE